MTILPSQRQDQILKWLQEKQSLTIDEMVQFFGVSIMTIHRDLDALAQMGLVEKVYGGVMLNKAKTDDSSTCPMCNSTISDRTRFIIKLATSDTTQACCPHCGLMLMDGQAVKSALTRDFLYERVTNVLQATYVMGSHVILCCSPSVLCFAIREDAERFQMGFGGQVMTYEEAQAALHHQHGSMHHHPPDHKHSTD